MRRHLPLLLTAALFVPAAARGQPPRAGGVDLVPTTAFGFVTVRISDLRDVEALRPVREAVARFEKAGDGLEKELGVGFDEVDRLTMFWPAPTADADQEPIIILTTRAPFNEVKVLQTLRAIPVDRSRVRPGRRPGAGAPTPVAPKPATSAPDAGGHSLPTLPKGPGQDGAQVKDEPPRPPRIRILGDEPPEKEAAPADGPEVFLVNRGGSAALIRIDSRTLMFIPGPGADRGAGLLGLVGQLLRRRADGPLAEALAAADRHTLVAAIRLGQAEPLLREHGEFPRELVPFRSLLRARTAMVTADLAARATVTARLTFADAAAARRAEPVLKTLMQLGTEALADLRKEAGRDPEWANVFHPLLDLATGAFDKAEVRTDGSVVVAHLDAEVGPALTKALAALPDLTEVATGRQKTLNNLKQIALACHNFDATMGHLPANITDPTGKPLLSWRVAILPYVEQENIYRQLDLTRAWDDPRNAQLLAKMPDVFRVYGRSGHEKGLTYLQMPMSPQSGQRGGDPFLVPGQRRRFAGITDGTSNTIMVIEAAEGVAWAKPDDVRYDPAKLPKVGAEGRKWFYAAMADGSVRTFDRGKLTDEQLKALLTINGGEVVNVEGK